MLVEMVDAVAYRIREPQRARDVGAARAARDDQFLRNRIPVAQDVADRRGALPQRRALRGLAEHEVQRRREAGADRLVALLERSIVGVVELADARGIAAAAKVLEQQGVIESPRSAWRQADRAADLHPDPAGADAMAGGLTFGEVERIAERRDDLGPAGGGS